MDYTPQEMMTIAAARTIRNRDIVFCGNDHHMFLKPVYPVIQVADVVQNIGFDIDVARVEPVPLPSAKERRILRNICDPQKLILG